MTLQSSLCISPIDSMVAAMPFDVFSSRSVSREPNWSEAVRDTLGKKQRTFRGNSRPGISDGKRHNSDWLAEQAARRSEKEIADLTGMTTKAVGNIRQRRNKLSFDNFVEWCRNDHHFAAAFAEYVGLIRPGEAEFAGAITHAFNAYQRQRGEQ